MSMVILQRKMFTPRKRTRRIEKLVDRNETANEVKSFIRCFYKKYKKFLKIERMYGILKIEQMFGKRGAKRVLEDKGGKGHKGSYPKV